MARERAQAAASPLSSGKWRVTEWCESSLDRGRGVRGCGLSLEGAGEAPESVGKPWKGSGEEHEGEGFEFLSRLGVQVLGRPI